MKMDEGGDAVFLLRILNHYKRIAKELEENFVHLLTHFSPFKSDGKSDWDGRGLESDSDCTIVDSVIVDFLLQGLGNTCF